MDEITQHIQTYMIVWNVNLEITTTENLIVISTPLFYLKCSEADNQNWIKIYANTEMTAINITSNISSIRAFKGCTTYLISPSTRRVLDVFRGFGYSNCNQHILSGNVQFVFEIRMQCDDAAVPAILWKQCSTKIKQPINADEILLKVGADSVHTVSNNQNSSCVVAASKMDLFHCVDVAATAENHAENWNLFTLILQRMENNVWRFVYIHTFKQCTSQALRTHSPFIIYGIKELQMSLENVKVSEISAISSIIQAHLTPTKVSEGLQRVNMTAGSTIFEYFVDNKLCDVTVHVQNHKIRAHKLILATGSVAWRDIFFANEILDTLRIEEFEYETIRELIEYIYTGKYEQQTQAVEQLLIAADKYGVPGLKELCELKLIEIIDIKTVVNLLVLSDRYKAGALWEKAMEFIRENNTAFKELEEAKMIFMSYPELAFKLYERIT